MHLAGPRYTVLMRRKRSLQSRIFEEYGWDGGMEEDSPVMISNFQEDLHIYKGRVSAVTEVLERPTQYSTGGSWTSKIMTQSHLPDIIL